MIEIATAIQEGAHGLPAAPVQDHRRHPDPAGHRRLPHLDRGAQAGRRREALSFVESGLFRTLAFLAGCFLSGLTGFIGMSLAVRGNVRTAAAAKTGSMPAALQVAFRTGGVAGMFTVGLGLLGATIIIIDLPEHELGDPRRLRVRWLAAGPVPAGRRRHLHQGRRRRRRPGRQGRGRHPRGRPPQPGHHRRQRGRQRRRLRRHGRRPVRVLRGHPGRLDHPRAWPPSSPSAPTPPSASSSRWPPGPSACSPPSSASSRCGPQRRRDQRPQAHQPGLPHRRRSSPSSAPPSWRLALRRQRASTTRAGRCSAPSSSASSWPRSSAA